MNRIAARIVSGAIAALLVTGAAGVAHADSTDTPAPGPVTATSGQSAASGGEPAPGTVGPLTNDWG
ncbi:hypothetical protein [Streptomyces sp. NPDC048659]|uniref:hypothetical protein n=1 Tax=Streptomyces sp. NPDC048659 TaxID=3155489 RepID=UPI00343CB7B1